VGRDVAAIPEELHALLKYCMEFSRVMLVDSGQFQPFGATVGKDGKVAAVAGDIGSEHPDSRERYPFLAGAFAEQARSGQIFAAALAANVNIPAEYPSRYRDGVRVQIESARYARYIYVPYRVQGRGLFRRERSVSFGEPFAVEIRPQIFLPEARA
jgi:hypothetical protein